MFLSIRSTRAQWNIVGRRVDDRRQLPWGILARHRVPSSAHSRSHSVLSISRSNHWCLSLPRFFGSIDTLCDQQHRHREMPSSHVAQHYCLIDIACGAERVSCYKTKIADHGVYWVSSVSGICCDIPCTWTTERPATASCRTETWSVIQLMKFWVCKLVRGVSQKGQDTSGNVYHWDHSLQERDELRTVCTTWKMNGWGDTKSHCQERETEREGDAPFIHFHYSPFSLLSYSFLYS